MFNSFFSEYLIYHSHQMAVPTNRLSRFVEHEFRAANANLHTDVEMSFPFSAFSSFFNCDV